MEELNDAALISFMCSISLVCSDGSRKNSIYINRIHTYMYISPK